MRCFDFDTTCASGKPDFVDKMFQQEITDPDGYICLCFERLIKRIGHPTLNSPVLIFLVLQQYQMISLTCHYFNYYKKYTMKKVVMME